MMKKNLLLGFFLIAFGVANAQQLIQGTLKLGPGPNDIEVWLKPNFDNNNVQYLFQIGMPIAFPANANPQPTSLINVTLDPAFITAFGNNYSITKNVVAHNTANTEKYLNIVLVRGGLGASVPQAWTSGAEFKVLTATFSPSGAPATPVKLADYQDGGSDGLGNFYTQDGNNNYYITSNNSVGNFYATPGQSTVGGTASAGYVQTNTPIPPLVCTTPAAPVVTGITTTAATINWTAVSGVAGYEYAVTNSATPPTSGTATTSTTYSATGLTPATQYYAHLRSSCGGSNFSAWVSTPFTTQNSTCTTPSTPIINNITTTSADINWNVVSGAVGYEYAITTASTPPVSGTATTATTYSATGLTTGTAYYVHLRSNCGGGFFSSWVSTLFSTLCPTTSVPVVSNITATAATINWTAVGGGAAGYEYAISTSSIAPVSGMAIVGTTYNTTSLIPGTLYYIYVRTVCNAGNFSAWISTSFTTLCPATTTPLITLITPTTATINWSAVSGVTGYEYAVSISALPPVSGTAIVSTTYNATGLTVGTTYYVYVRSSCSPGIFSAWASANFTTPYPPCLAPSTPVITNISNTADISWGTVSGAAGYEYVVTTSNITPISGTPTMATTYHATGLNSVTQYYVYVRSNCGLGGYSPWVSKAFTTGCLATAVTINTNSNNGVDISWNNVNGAVNYEYAVTTYFDPPLGGIVTTDTSLHLASLAPGVGYYFQIRTYCAAGGISGWSTYPFHAPGLDAYPNPVTNSVTINLYGTSSGNGQLSVYDAAGKLLRKITLVGNTIVLDTRGFAAGVYLIRYVDGDSKYTVKVLKE